MEERRCTRKLNGYIMRKDQPIANESALLAHMASEWLPALFGVIGTLLGGSVTLTANWLTSNTQRHLAAEDRIQQNAAIRREAYAPFLAAASMIKDRGHELAEAIRAETRDEERIASLRKVYYESWEEMKGKRPLALIVGPGGMPEKVDDLHGSLIDFREHIDEIYRDKPNHRSPKYNRLVVNIDNAFAEFARAAREYAVASEPDLITDRKIAFFKKPVNPAADKANPTAVTGQQESGTGTPESSPPSPPRRRD